MMRPPDSDPSQPYPNIRSALMLTLLAVLAAGFTSIAFMDFGLLTAVGIGQAIGVGAVATWGAQRVAEPQAERLGLRALDLEAIPMILCLVPAVLLASELDNLAADWSGETASISAPYAGDADGSPYDSADEDAIAADYDAIPADAHAEDGDDYDYDYDYDRGQSQGQDRGRDYDQDGSPEDAGGLIGADGADGDDRDDRDPDARGGGRDRDAAGASADEGEDGERMRLIDPDDPMSVLSAVVVMVGISPVVEEFLFRGVIQQGIVARLGLIRGVSVVALLWTLLRPAPLAGFTRFLAAAVASFALGWALGIVRIATRSILGPILLASGWAAIGLAAVVLEGRVALPGLNVPGSHLPILVTLASAGIVGWAGWTLFQEAERRFAEEALSDQRPPGGPGGGSGPGGLGGGGGGGSGPDGDGEGRGREGEGDDSESQERADGDGRDDDGRPPLRLV